MKKLLALLAGILALAGIYFVATSILASDYARACFWLLLTVGNTSTFFRYAESN